MPGKCGAFPSKTPINFLFRRLLRLAKTQKSLKYQRSEQLKVDAGCVLSTQRSEACCATECVEIPVRHNPILPFNWTNAMPALVLAALPLVILFAGAF